MTASGILSDVMYVLGLGMPIPTREFGRHSWLVGEDRWLVEGWYCGPPAVAEKDGELSCVSLDSSGGALV